MIRKPRPAYILLPGLMLAACAALPGEAAAQTTMSTRGPGTLSTAMAEALRSPFHASTVVERLVVVEPVAVSVPHPGDQQDAESSGRPSFHRVFLPTLGAVLLSEWVSLGLLADCLFDSCSDAEGTAKVLTALPILVLSPPTAARIAGGSFTRGLLGSAAGFALGMGLSAIVDGFGVDGSIAFLALPATHSLVTTFLSRL